jgi:membrane protein involved in colicin uptake
MGQLINSGTVPPMENGDADLDRAYDMALWAMPEIRQKVLADQQKKAEDDRKAKAEAEKRAQQEAADKARKANAGSLAQSAPGSPLQNQNKPKKGKTVRESIMEARDELMER